MQPKPIISINKAVNWYIGNYIQNHNNALRDKDELMLKARQDIEKIKNELKGMKLTHKQFLNLIKDMGFHSKYYLYKKPEPRNCEICRIFGIK